MDEKPDVVVPPDQAPSYQLEIEDIVVGDGDEAVSGRVVEVHYVGVSWKTGQQFDASWDRGSTFKFSMHSKIGSGFRTMPSPPPNGRSSTVRCRSRANVRRS